MEWEPEFAFGQEGVASDENVVFQIVVGPIAFWRSKDSSLSATVSAPQQNAFQALCWNQVLHPFEYAVTRLGQLCFQ
jgi:hypothetical protein